MAAGNVAYGATDVMHDPNYLLQAMQTHDPKQRAYYEKALDRLYTERNLAEQINAREQGRRENIAARGLQASEGRATREQIAGENLAQRQDRARQVAQAAAMEEKDRLFSRLMTAAALLPPTDPRAKQLQERALQMVGMQPTTTPQTPGEQAAARGAQMVGQPVAPTQGAAGAAGGTAAAAPPAGAAGVPPTGAPPTGQLVPGALATSGEGPAQTPEERAAQAAAGPPVGPEGTAFRYYSELQKATGQPHWEGAQIVGGPAGMSYNASTGEWIPSSREGTINGIPESHAVAAAALRTGKAPVYSGEKTWNLYNQLRPGAEPAIPTLSSGPTGTPGFGGRPVSSLATPPAKPAEPATAAAPPTGGGVTGDVSPFGIPTAAGIGHALSGLYNIPGVRESMAPNPPSFAPSSGGQQVQGPPTFSPGAGLTSQPQTPGMAPGAQPQSAAIEQALKARQPGGINLPSGFPPSY